MSMNASGMASTSDKTKPEAASAPILVPLLVAKDDDHDIGTIDNDKDQNNTSNSTSTSTSNSDNQQQQGTDATTATAIPAASLKKEEPLEQISFELTEEEQEAALAIKDAIEGLPDLDPLSDFMYAHMAIAGKGDLEWAIERAYKLQAVKQEYKILGTYEEGIRLLQMEMQVHPGNILAFNCNPYNGQVEFVMDMTKWNRNAWRDPTVLDNSLRTSYYVCHCLFPTFETVRVGNIHIAETKGYDWNLNMMDLKLFSKISETSHGSFPSHLQQTRFYHTPMLLNVMVSMAKRYVPKDLSDGFRLGCTFAGGRLDKFYLQPDPETARQRTYAKLCESLKLRLECERTFSLDG